MVDKKYIVTTALLAIILLPFMISMQSVYAFDDVSYESNYYVKLFEDK